MKKKLFCLLLTAALCAGVLATGALAAEGYSLSSSVSYLDAAGGAASAAVPGGKVIITVSGSGADIGGLQLKVSVGGDGVLQNPVYTLGDILSGGSMDAGAGNVIWVRMDGTNSAVNGTLATLAFDVAESAEEGDVTVTISGLVSIYNEDGTQTNLDNLNTSATATIAGKPEPPCTHGDTELQNQKEATCTEEGYTGDKVCKSCGAVVEKGEVTPAKGHTWDDGTVTKEATCTEDGEKTVTCTACGATETQTIPAKGHTWDEGKVTKEATATEKGEKTYTCTVCGETMTEEIPAMGSGSGGNNGKDGSNTGEKKSPQTGDDSAIGLWAVTLLACAGVLALTLGAKKKHN